MRLVRILALSVLSIVLLASACASRGDDRPNATPTDSSTPTTPAAPTNPVEPTALPIEQDELGLAPGDHSAIVPVGGAVDLEVIAASEPVATLHIHSLDDPRAIYEGGLGPPFPGTETRIPHEPVFPRIEQWAAGNGCDTTPSVGPVVNGEGSDRGQTVQRFTWSGCLRAARVEHLLLAGSGHGWPGVETGPVWQRLLGPPTTIVDASEQVWAFASQFQS